MRNNKTKIVIDTNIFLNAFIFSEAHENCVKAMSIVMDLIDQDKAELVFSQDTIGELMYMIKTHLVHSKLTEEERLSIMNLLSIIVYYSYTVNTEYTIAPTCEDKKDDMFIKCATQGRARYIITNDIKSRMNKVVGIRFKVVTAQEYIDIMEKEAVAVGE